MDAEASDLPIGDGRVEGLAVDLVRLAPVHGEGEVRRQALKIQQRRAVAHLLVRAEADRHAPVRAFLDDQPLAHGQDLGDAGLVVRAENGHAVGGDEGLALQAAQMREILR